MDAAAPGERACPACGETIRSAAILCRFCKADLAAPAGRPSPPPPSRPRGWPLVLAVLAAGLAGPVLVLVGLGFFVVVADREEDRESCRRQLAALHLWFRHAEESVDGPPEGTGSALLRAMAWQADDGDLADCPGGGFITGGPYRGPTKPWTQLGDEEVVACCPPGAHSGGAFVLLKNGRIRFARDGDALHAAAAAQTSE
ncbi:MAG TPA: hypothetical protein VEJ18_16115 [Planctomycetota bacterium]|nr:hypothetical protein [Planctomycetota bacterium]